MRIAICEDEEKMQRQMTALLQTIFEDYDLSKPTIEVFKSGEALIAAYQQGEAYDLIFMDIEMGEMSGMVAAKQIRQSDEAVSIVFMTSHQEEMPQAFAVEALDFLTKPIQCKRLTSVFERFLAKYKARYHEVCFLTKAGVIVLLLKDIVYFNSYGKLLMVGMQDGTVHEVKKKISEAEAELAQQHFMRCHHGYIINLAYIKEIKNHEIITKPLKNGQNSTIPISRRYLVSVKEAFLRFKVRGGNGYR